MADQPRNAFTPEMIEAYLLGQLTSKQVAVLEQALRDDAQVRLQFAHAMQVMSMVREAFRESEEQGTVQQAEPMLEDFNRLLAELAQAEQKAETVRVHLANAVEMAPARQTPWDRPTAKEFGQVLYYLGTRPAVWGPIAAVLVLGLALTLVLRFGGASQTNLSPGNESAIAIAPAPRAAEPAVVASLTATHQARWAGKPVAAGEPLRTGQRLTLTQGFAEITTRRGAVVILEAPATVEMLDSANAIRLHTGKLVGICETESSKGFVVSTSHLEVTDLGTRFGVDVLREASTEVHVFKGEVEVASNPITLAVNEPRRLTAGQSARADAAGSAITVIDHDPSRFAAIKPVKIPLSGTGFGLAVGEIDSGWQLISENGQPVTGRETMSMTDAPGLVAWVANDPAQAQWIIAQPTIAPPVGQPIPYVIQTTFKVPESIDPASARLVIDCVVDNELTAVEINGHRLAIDRQEDAELHAVSLVIQDHLRPGTNTLRFLVINVGSTTKGNRPAFTPDGILSNNHVGLRLTWELHGTTTLFRQ